MRLGELLLQHRVIAPEQLHAALDAQQRYGGRLGTNLFHLGYIDVDLLSRALGQQKNLPAALRKHVALVDKRVLSLFSDRVTQAFHAIPIGYTPPADPPTDPPTPQRLILACVDPEGTPIEEFAFTAGCRVDVWVAPEILIQEGLEKYYGAPRAQPRYVDVGVAGSGPPVSLRGARAPSGGPRSQRGGRASDEGSAVARGAAGSGRPAVARNMTPPPTTVPESARPPYDPPPTIRRTSPPPPPPSPPPPPPRFAPSEPSLVDEGPVSEPAPSSPPIPHISSMIPAVSPRPSDRPAARSASTRPSASPAAELPIAEPPGPKLRISYTDLPPDDGWDTPDEPELAAQPSPEPALPVVPPPVVPPPVVPPPPPTSRSLVSSPPSNPPSGDRGFHMSLLPGRSQHPVSAPPGILRPFIDTTEAARLLASAPSKDDVGQVLEDWLRSTFGCGLVLVVKNEVAVGWRGYFPDAEDMIEAVAVPIDKPSMLRGAYATRVIYCGAPIEDDAKLNQRLWKLLRCPPPSEVLVCPVVVGTRTVNLLYTHALDASAPLTDAHVRDAMVVAAGASAAYLRLIKRDRVKA